MHIIIHLAKSGFLTVIKELQDEFYNWKETRKKIQDSIVDRQYIYILTWVSGLAYVHLD
jgi:hypothetical protein